MSNKHGLSDMPAMSMAADHGELFELGDRVVCEDPQYSFTLVHQTVSGEIVALIVDPFDKIHTLAMLKRDDGFSDGGGPHGEWYARLEFCKKLPAVWMSPEQTAQASMGAVEKGYVPDRPEDFCVVGPNGRLL